jgi:hypothetical protein
MKRIFKFLLLFSFVSSLMANELGQETVAKVREAYEGGEYDAFLSQMEKDYQETFRENRLEGLAALRKEAHVKLSDRERKELDQKFFALKAERNKRLLAAIQGEGESEFTRKVRSLASDLPEHNLIDFHVLAPEEGVSPDERRLIATDLELEYKLIHAASVEGEKKGEKLVALKMQNADRLAGLVAVMEDEALKARVQQYADHTDAYLAKELDAADLHPLGQGKVKPQNSIEQKVADILAWYQIEWSHLQRSSKATDEMVVH